MEDQYVSSYDVIADYKCVIGENPLWHPDEHRLYWTDIPVGRIYQFDPRAGTHKQIYSGRPVGGFTFQRNGGLLLFRDGGSIALWQEGRLKELLAEIPGERGSRFNDVISDPSGRVFCGTMAEGGSVGRLYCLDTDGSLRTLVEGVGCSNGMGFAPDLNAFYYTDSFAGEIYRFDYDRDSGMISKRRLLVRIPSGLGLPDGLTVDRSGHLWTALWDGYGFLRISPDGDLLQKFSLPVKKVSSITFGGDQLRDLYVTTAGGDSKQENGEHAGALVRVHLDVRGVEEFRSNLLCNDIRIIPASAHCAQSVE